jgi:aryl-alcohol dehydrogenase-like predicted oxidoreductase
VGARTAEQVKQNVAAMSGEIAPEVMEQLTSVSDETIKGIPDTGNIFRYYP